LSHAQSMYMAKQYYEDGNYLEAAKQLRPLADGGNAEAQLMAAKLFFEGKGVNKNDAQGVKYAKMAADQGNEEAIKVLAEHFWKANPEKSFEILKQYTDRHPYLKQKQVGMMLAECYFRPHGTMQDEELGWEIAKSNEKWENYLMNDKVAGLYFDYRMRCAGKTSLEDYADFMYLQRQTEDFNAVCEYIKRLHPDMISHYTLRANQGNSFAQAMYADNLYNRNKLPEARHWIKLALTAGSAYAKSLERKIMFVPVTYDNVSGHWTGEDFNNKLYLLKIEHQYNKTIFSFNYKAVHGGASITFDKGIYVLYNGRKYMMTSPAKRIRNANTNAKGNDNFFSVEFEPLPTEWSELNIGYRNVLDFINIRHESTGNSKLYNNSTLIIDELEDVSN